MKTQDLTESERLVVTKYDLLFESRLSKTEQTLDDLRDTCKEIKSDMRLMLVLILGATVIILATMARGFHWF